YVYNGATFTMTGGSIASNQATYTGNYSIGGVFVANAANTNFIMTGGSIASNSGYTAGGVYVVGVNGKVSLGGTAQIYSGNTANSKANNLYFANGSSVALVTSAFKSGAKISVTRVNGEITSGYGTYNTGVSSDTYFAVDNEAEYLTYETGSGTSAEAFVSSKSNATNWDWFISRSTSTGSVQTVKLYSDWTAQRDTTGFAVSNNTSGALLVPSNAKIILDLNGFNLDRNYTSATSNGFVIYVQGQLTIRDSKAGNAKITGGFSSSSGTAGGIYVYSGSLTLESGHIYNNKMSSSNGAGGVWLNSNTTFTMTGGYIDNNSTTSSSAGAIWINNQTASRFIMTGGRIQNNSTTSTSHSGGVHVYSPGVLRLGGGAIIENNTSAGIPRNVYSTDNATKYEIVETITSAFHVGITKTNNNYTNTSGLVFTTNWYTYSGGASPIGKFFSDDSMYDVVSAGSISQREAAIWCIDGAKNWDEACAASSNDGKQRTVTLYKNWEAGYHSSYTTTFASALNGSYFSSGALYIYGSMNI
ncbi:MAG: hypothetical protein K2L87_02945, partial [Clostridiales bacterium]|nr:hypothetical protein [Clostridiales bacterium]